MTMRRGYTPIKAISVKRDKPGVPRPEGTYDSGHEPLDEDELHDYQACFGLLGDPQEDIGQSSTHPPPPPPQQPSEAAPSSPTPDIEDLVLALTERFDAFWDETQEHRVLLTQDMEALRADMHTVLANTAIILQQQQSLQAQLARLLAHHQPPPPPPPPQRLARSPGEYPPPSYVISLPVGTLPIFCLCMLVYISV